VLDISTLLQISPGLFENYMLE